MSFGSVGSDLFVFIVQLLSEKSYRTARECSMKTNLRTSEVGVFGERSWKTIVGVANTQL